MEHVYLLEYYLTKTLARYVFLLFILVLRFIAEQPESSDNFSVHYLVYQFTDVTIALRALDVFICCDQSRQPFRAAMYRFRL